MYHVFAGDDYYPRGGVRGHRGAYATYADAYESVAYSCYDWWQIVTFTSDGAPPFILHAEH